MQVVLAQLNALPGVVGSLVCSGEGRVLAHAFPPVFEPAAIEEVARALVDGAMALPSASEPDDLLDLRFKDVRLLARPFSGAWLAVLCSRTTNLQLILLSMTAAIARLNKLGSAGRAPEAEPAEAVELVPAAPGRQGEARPKASSSVAAPTRGLEELRRRLAAPRDRPPEQAPVGVFPPTSRKK